MLFRVDEPCPLCGAAEYLGERHARGCQLGPLRPRASLPARIKALVGALLRWPR